MLIRSDVCNHGGDFPISPDNERGTLDSHKLLSVHAFFFKHPITLGDRLIFIRQQGEGKPKLILKLFLGGGFIWRDAKDYSTGFLELLVFVTEPGRLCGSTGGIRPCIKK